MRNFVYSRPQTQRAAISALSQRAAARLLGGGTNLIDLMRENIEQPEVLVDVLRLPLNEVSELPDGGVRIGAAVRNSALASHALILERYPALSEAILNGASGQIRNMATTAGNIMQRTRCPYFYDAASRCNKRRRGSGCDALEGANRNHAILGASPHCIATHPSDMCVALAAMDARVRVCGPAGERVIPFEEFHRLPGETPQLETNLAADEMITAVDLPRLDFLKHSMYRKARERASYAFALTAVAAALEMRDGRVANVRIALGGVAHKPWRARHAEALLTGGPADRAAFAKGAAAELLHAKPLPLNAFKMQLAQNMMVAVLCKLAERAGPS
jgi:xanthine dehydrogenase YagS FAD-binding subunit